MRIVHTPDSSRHDPERYLRRGAAIPHPEQAARYAILRDAAARGGHALAEPADHGLEPIRAVHDPDYVAFLAEAEAADPLAALCRVLLNSNEFAYVD